MISGQRIGNILKEINGYYHGICL